MGIRRRDFLKTGAATATVAGAAGAGGLLGSACAGLLGKELLQGAGVPLPDMNEYLRTVDDGLRQISDWNLGDEVGETERDLSRENALAKKALRTIYLAGMLGDLPDAGQVHPGMQARVKRALPEMDEAIFEACEYLDEISEEESREIRELLNERSDPGMEFADWIDRKEWTVGVSTGRRLQTRAMITKAVSRMRKQSPRALIDETVGKTRRLAARSGTLEEVQRQMIARMGEQAFWERQQRLAAYSAAWEAQGATAQDVPLPDVPPVELPEPVEADAGVADEPGQVVAPTENAAPAVPTPTATETAAPEDPQTCEEINAAAHSLTRELEHKFISYDEYVTRWRDLDARFRRLQCRPWTAEDVHHRDSRKKSKAPSKKGSSAAGWTAGIGGIVILGGAVLLIAGGAAGGFGPAIVGAVFLTVGVVLLLIAMIIAIVHAAKG